MTTKWLSKIQSMQPGRRRVLGMLFPPMTRRAPAFWFRKSCVRKYEVLVCRFPRFPQSAGRSLKNSARN
ncbi:UNVERIFIED_CONTAM: hypothetical protein GTU68_050210 [Idotea baltica]|nr:hypothetical protein [Idotea baltica]